MDTYGKWLPMGNKEAVNRLDDESGSKTVAKKLTGTPAVTEVPVDIGGPSRTRTLDPLIKSDPESIRSSDPIAGFLPATVESVRGTILCHNLIGEGELKAALAACRRHLADPDTGCSAWGGFRLAGRSAAPPGGGTPARLQIGRIHKIGSGTNPIG